VTQARTVATKGEERHLHQDTAIGGRAFADVAGHRIGVRFDCMQRGNNHIEQAVAARGGNFGASISASSA